MSILLGLLFQMVKRFQGVGKNSKHDDNKDFLHRQLVKLGDMMGDGLHHEPDGKWIAREYKKTCRALGIGPKRRNNTATNNAVMAERIKNVACQKCQGELKQTRSGSLRASCVDCGAKFQLLKRK